MITRNAYAASLLSILVAVTVGCAKKEKSGTAEADADDPAATGGGTPAGAPLDQDPPVVDGQVAVTGTLGLDLSLTAAAAPNKVLAFEFMGEGFLSPQVAALDADGKFSLNLSKTSSQLGKLEAAVSAEGVVDRAKAGEAIGQTLDDSISDQEIKEYIAELKEQAEKRGGSTYVLVAMSDAGTPVEQADSFRFIGMPTGDDNMVAMPVAQARGNLLLGEIGAGAGDEAKAARAADGATFSLNDDVLGAFASTGKILKDVKNFHANGKDYRAENFYMWKPTAARGGAFVGNKWSTAEGVALGGYGFYIRANKGDFLFDEICPTSGAVAAKRVTLVPSADVVIDQPDMTPDKTISAASPFNNVGLSRGSQSGNQICLGSDTGFYVRRDTDDGKEMMINWGTGGSIKVGTGIPAGWWKLQLDGSTVAQFDVSAANPIDSAGKPKVFLPLTRANLAGDGSVDSVEVKLAFWNGAAFEELTDPTAFLALANGLEFEAEYYVGNANNTSSIRGSLTRVEGEARWTFDIPADKPIKFQGDSFSQSAFMLQNFAVYYGIGSQSFRTDYVNN